MNALQINHKDANVINMSALEDLIQAADILFTTSGSIKRLYGSSEGPIAAIAQEKILQKSRRQDGQSSKYIIITQVRRPDTLSATSWGTGERIGRPSKVIPQVHSSVPSSLKYLSTWPTVRENDGTFFGITFGLT